MKLIGVVLVVGLLVTFYASVGYRTSPEPVRAKAGVKRCSFKDPDPIVLTPKQGPVGTKVRFSGGCFPKDLDLSGYGVFLLHDFRRPRDCELLVGGATEFKLRADGRAHGWFVVGAHGHCFQQDYGRNVTPASYSLGIGCHACPWGTFRVTD